MFSLNAMISVLETLKLEFAQKKYRVHSLLKQFLHNLVVTSAEFHANLSCHGKKGPCALKKTK